MSIQPPASFWQAAADVANGLHAPRNASVLRALAAWEWCEKIHGGAGAWQWDNPLNTTEPGFGATGSVNSVGVKIYPSQTQGVAAVVATMTNGFYPGIVSALRAGNGAGAVAQAGEIATWGTNPTCVRQDYAAMASPPAQYLASPSATHTGSAGPGPNSAGLAIATFAPAPAGPWWLAAGGVAALGVGGYLAAPWLREQVARRGPGRTLRG